MKIIICDSGISRKHSSKINTIDLGKGIYDENGHGSSILEVINECIEYLDITSIKVLDRDKACEMEVFLLLLDTLENLEADIICMALSFDSDVIPEDFLLYLRSKFQNLYDQGKTIIAADYNRGKNFLPAAFESVIGVKASRTLNHGMSFDPSAIVQCEIASNPVICEIEEGRFRYLSGNSLAAALYLREMCAIHINDYVTPKLMLLRDYNPVEKYITMLRKNLDEWKVYEKILKHLTEILANYYDINEAPHSLIDYPREMELDVFMAKIIQYDYRINSKALLKIEMLETLENLAMYLYLEGKDG